MAKRSMLRDGAARGAYAKVLHMADGGAVSPYSLRGMADSVSSLASAAMKPFTRPAGYEPAVVAAPAAAPVAAPAPAAPVQLGGVNLGAMRTREAAAGLRDGGPIRGHGGPTEDNIPIMASAGEHMLPADTVQALGGHAAVDKVIDATHTPVRKGLRGGYANGGGIPGIDVTENPRLTYDEAKGFAPKGGPVPPAVSNLQESSLRSGATAVGRTAGQAVRGFGPAALAGAATSGFGDYKVNDPGVDSSAMGTLRAVGNGDFSGAADSLKKGAVETGLDLASGLAKTGDIFLPGHPLSDGLRNRVTADLGSQVTAPTSAPVSTTSLEHGPQARTDVQTGGAAAAPAPLANDVTRVGNSFSGSNISGTPTINGSALRNGGFVSAGGGPDVMATEARAGQIYRDMAAIQNGQDQPGAMSNGSGMRVVGGSSFFRNAKDEPAASSIDTRGMSQRQIANLAMEREKTSALRENNRENNATSRANTTDTVNEHLTASREGNQVSLRGQDVTQRGQDMTSRTAANAARLDQMNKDRTFQFDVQKEGRQVAESNFNQREKAIKDVHEEIGGMLPPVVGPDGKQAPDTATAARYAAALTAHLGTVQAGLEAKAARGDAKASAALNELRTKGVGALDAKDKQRFVAGMQAADAAQQNSTGAFNPIGGRAVISPNPVGSLRKTSPGFLGFGGEYTSDRGDTIPARVVERDGSYFGGLRNRSYDPLIRN